MNSSIDYYCDLLTQQEKNFQVRPLYYLLFVKAEFSVTSSSFLIFKKFYTYMYMDLILLITSENFGLISLKTLYV